MWHRFKVDLGSWSAQEAGIDVRLGELAGYIQETMESYEVEVNGKVHPGTFSSLRERT